MLKRVMEWRHKRVFGFKKSEIFCIWPSLNHFPVGIGGSIVRVGRFLKVRCIGYGYIWRRYRGFFYGRCSTAQLLYCQGRHMKWEQGNV